jgi:hypothetical protein
MLLGEFDRLFNLQKNLLPVTKALNLPINQKQDKKM